MFVCIVYPTYLDRSPTATQQLVLPGYDGEDEETGNYSFFIEIPKASYRNSPGLHV